MGAILCFRVNVLFCSPTCCASQRWTALMCEGCPVCHPHSTQYWPVSSAGKKSIWLSSLLFVLILSTDDQIMLRVCPFSTFSSSRVVGILKKEDRAQINLNTDQGRYQTRILGAKAEPRCAWHPHHLLLTNHLSHGQVLLQFITVKSESCNSPSV